MLFCGRTSHNFPTTENRTIAPRKMSEVLRVSTTLPGHTVFLPGKNTLNSLLCFTAASPRFCPLTEWLIVLTAQFTCSFSMRLLVAASVPFRNSHFAFYPICPTQFLPWQPYSAHLLLLIHYHLPPPQKGMGYKHSFTFILEISIGHPNSKK